MSLEEEDLLELIDTSDIIKYLEGDGYVITHTSEEFEDEYTNILTTYDLDTALNMLKDAGPGTENNLLYDKFYYLRYGRKFLL